MKYTVDVAVVVVVAPLLNLHSYSRMVLYHWCESYAEPHFCSRNISFKKKTSKMWIISKYLDIWKQSVSKFDFYLPIFTSADANRSRKILKSKINRIGFQNRVHEWSKITIITHLLNVLLLEATYDLGILIEFNLTLTWQKFIRRIFFSSFHRFQRG